MKSRIDGLSSRQIRNPRFASVAVGGRGGTMATLNPFDLLEDDDTEDPSLLIAAQQKKIEQKKPSVPPEKQPPPPAKLPSKPIPPSEAVREAKTESGRGGSSGRGRGYGRDRGASSGFNRDSTNNNSPGNKAISGAQGATDEADSRASSGRGGGYGGPRGPFRGGRRVGFSNGGEDEGEHDRPRRAFDRHSGTGRGGEMKREGSGRGNWGTQIDEPVLVVEEAPNEGEKVLDAEKPSGEKDAATDGNKEEAASNEVEEKKPEDKEMTLEEYEKVREEKRKALQVFKPEERKVDTKEFQAMKQLANKKTSDDIFVKLGSEKDKRKESAEKEEKAKKSVSINEFLKPPEGQSYYSSGGRGRGRGRGHRGGYGGASDSSNFKAPSIEDQGQFPTLGGK